MDRNPYQVAASKNKLRYQFVSSGNNGEITKDVQMQEMGVPYRFNLAMGDVVEEEGEVEINYDVVTNNGDLETVFGTISEIIKYFTSAYTGAEVFVTGNTPVKKRLYRKAITTHLEEIEKEFEVYGTMNEEGTDGFIEFERGVNYNGFLFKRK